MNLYIESLTSYIETQWDRALEENGGANEARLIVESLDSTSTFELFQALDVYRLQWLSKRNIACYFRVATGLWRDWCEIPGTEARLHNQMSALGALGPHGDREWIDEEDRLTWYRSRTTQDEKVDGLIVVLVGFNHATDQGGLADFHRVDEARIWREMGESFVSWLETVNERLAVNASDTELQQFDIVIKQLFTVRPFRLGKLAQFIEEEVIAGQEFYSFSEFSDRFLERLPFWGIPPIFSAESSNHLRGKKAATALNLAETFISHQRYKTPTARSKDLHKIVNALSDSEFTLPQTKDGIQLYDGIPAYEETLKAFINEADIDARSMLLQTDITPLLEILAKVEPTKKSSKTIPVFTGMSFEVLLQGIWRTLGDFSTGSDHQPLYEVLSRIHIELVRFDHDLTDDDYEGVGAKELARELLCGCLGGLDRALESIDCRLPQDEDQASLPRSHWSRQVPISLDLALDELSYGTSRARPNVQFKVSVFGVDSELDTGAVYKWILGPTQPERVRFECAKKVSQSWSKAQNRERLLPAFRIPSAAMAALYYAADEDEANRLVAQSMTDLRLINLLDDLSVDRMDPKLWVLATDLISSYRSWLEIAITRGYYTARAEKMPQFLSSFISLSKIVLDTQLLGSSELLRRFYKSFLLVDERVEPNDPFLPGAIVWGLSPAVLELTQARMMFLADGFPEIIGELSIGRDGKDAFERLLDLSQIHRPIAALVVETQMLSAAIKSFGLLHYMGPEPPTSKSLAVQTLLREDGSDDDEDVRDIIRPCEERDLVTRVLNDYQQLYPFAEDGLRILAVNVRELQAILSGVDLFLDSYLKRTSADWPAFHCTVMVYSTSASPMAMENRLALWRNDVLDRQREQGRPLVLTVGHRYAPKEQIIELLKQEKRLYDIAFLFHFLRGGLVGHADPAMPFEYNFSGWSGLQFPITEYPRPTQAGDRDRRQSLLSNRRLRIQTCHADLSARLFLRSTATDDHVIFGQVDYKPWASIVETLHENAQWVACVDPFVDKRLLCDENGEDQRKIVGFASGLGAYGEINLTVSTEQDTLKQLSDRVAEDLTRLMPFEKIEACQPMATRVVGEAEEIIGLSSLRAVVGNGEKIREVLGFAAIRRSLSCPVGQISQLLPMDSLQHWFVGSDVALRPDLLQLTLEVRENDVPLVHAAVLECKFAQSSSQHLAKATEQVQDGLRHLTGLLAPSHSRLTRLGFDRRYWWAQLHRAMTSRSVVNLSDQGWRQLDHALEKLAEGIFEIRWQGAVFTFWTNEPGAKPSVSSLLLPAGTVGSPFQVPQDFTIKHFSLGYSGVSALFQEVRPDPIFLLDGPAIWLKPEQEVTSDTIENRQLTEEAPESSIPDTSPDHITETPVSENDLTENQFSHTEVDLAGETSEDQAIVSSHDQAEAPTSSGTTSEEEDNERNSAHTPQESTVVPIGQPERDRPFQVPEKIYIGTRSNGDKVFWHFGHPKLANRHLLIFGASGSGKTYGIQCLLTEMAKQQLRSLIIDYTDGFLPQQIEPLFGTVTHPKNHFVVNEGLPLNPFQRQQQIIDPSVPAIEESPYQVATRIESIFASIFGTMGDQQSAALIRTIQTGIEEDPKFTLDRVLSRLRDDSAHGESLANKLEPLIRSKPFREDEESAWEAMLSSSDHWVNVLQLKGLAREIQKMVTEFALWDLWDYVQNTGSKNRPIPVVLDEIQNLDHGSDSPIDKMLREGRKFGMSLILATQTTSQFDQEQRDRLFQAGHKLFFKPASTENDRFAQILAQATPGVSKAEWGQRLAKLEKGQCWSLGPVLKTSGTFKEEAVLVSVTSLEARESQEP